MEYKTGVLKLNLVQARMFFKNNYKLEFCEVYKISKPVATS